MRITRERNVVVFAIVLACALATAAWFASVTGRAELSPLKVKNGRAVGAPIQPSSTFNRFSPKQAADPLAPPSWEPVVLTSAQVEIKTWAFQGTTYAYLKFQFPDAGYRVVTFESPTRIGNDFTGGAVVEKFNGDSVRAETTSAGIYDLGPITPGSYSFTFKNSGASVESLAFTVTAPPFPANSIDDARQFVKQQYRDFLSREADQAGEDFWTDNIAKCSDPARRPSGQTEAQCTLRQRETTSGAFFRSPEFQDTGYFVYRMFQGGLGRQPKLSEFTPDAQSVGAGIVVNGQLSAAKINQNKADFAAQFANCTDESKYRCSEFKAIYDGLTNAQYVDKLFQTTGVNASASDRTALVNGLSTTPATETRASVLLKVVDGINVISEGNQQFTTSYGQAFYHAESNRAFVQFEYFGYMKRDPDNAGYAFWLDKLNTFGGNFVNAEMVLAFISSPEYRERFMVSAAGARVVIDKPSVFFPSSSGSTQLTARILDAQGAQLPGSITWTSTAPDKVSVDATGKLTSKAIGSAQIIAEAPGIRSAPTLVIVAQPQAGAVLVTDAQVVSVGPPLGLASGEAPGVGTQYEVTLEGVSAPALGTLMIATETAPIAGKVVATRQTAGGFVVTLELAPLYQLFSAYDIDLAIDLSAFPLEEVPGPSALATEGAMWQPGRNSQLVKAVARPLDALEKFKVFDCEASLKHELGDPPIQLTVDNQLKLILKNEPGHSKQALEGSLTLEATVGLKLKAGFKASGKCEAKVQVKLAVLGWLSVIVMPGVHVGLGAELKTTVVLVEGELGVKGKVGLTGALGWECGGATPACRGLETVKPIRELETKARFPSENDKRVEISAQFYAIAGLDAVILGGLANAEIVAAKIGPTQSFNLAFEDDQAERTDYASTYDLKLEGIIEPGSALKKAMEKVINGVSTDVKFEAKYDKDISESPKGTLSVSKAQVRPGDPVEFTVDLDLKTVDYAILGYNVVGVELWRKRSDESKFTRFKFMDLIHTTRATYKWVPVEADSGAYEFAAFVSTQLPVPLLEVSQNSIKQVEVACFGATATGLQFSSKASRFAMGADILAQTSACFDTWVGTATTGDQFGPNASEAQLTLHRDGRIDTGTEQIVAYYAEGTVKVRASRTISPGVVCTIKPSEFSITRNTGQFNPTTQGETNFFSLNKFTSPATFGGGGLLIATVTDTCTGQAPKTVIGYFPFFFPVEVPVSPDGLTAEGNNQPTWSFKFTRP